MAQSWKSRAETMLAQFINDDYDDNLITNDHNHAKYSPLFSSLYNSQENSSTSSSSSCNSALNNNNNNIINHDIDDYDYYFGVYDKLRCGCRGGGGAGSNNHEDGEVIIGQCVSLYLSWAKVAFARVIKAYVSSPLCLALVPLVLGVLIGFWMGRRRSSTVVDDETSSKGKRKIMEGGITNNLLEHLSRWLNWWMLQVTICMVALDPRTALSGKLYNSKDLELFQDERDERTRAELRGVTSDRESGVDLQCVPRHVAVIMDGNRRYGKAKYGNATRGHWDGSKILIEFSKWCIVEGIQTLTVYAFSTENWDRDPAEVSALMSIFCKYCEELRVEAIKQGIQIHVLSTEDKRIPVEVQEGINRMVTETQHCEKFTMNICLSYGGRGEIVNACQSIAKDIQTGKLDVDQIDECTMQNKMLTRHCCDPDIIIRTSGEERLSNFLLWQVAYSEFFFLKKQWPELQKEDLLNVIRTFAQGRKRRYGK